VPLIDIEIQTNLNVSGIKRDCGQSRRLSYSLAQALIQEGLGRADNSPRGRVFPDPFANAGFLRAMSGAAHQRHAL